MIRAFVAIALPQEVLERVGEYLGKLKRLQLEGNFSRLQSIHLTLKFLGDIGDEQVQPARELLLESIAETNRFQLNVRQIEAFPNPANPRVVWVGVEKNQVLEGLQQRIETNFEKLGIAREDRSFLPHLTLVRLRTRKNVRDLVHFIQNEGAGADAGSFIVKEVHLYQSILRPQGSEYVKLATVELS